MTRRRVSLTAAVLGAAVTLSVLGLAAPAQAATVCDATNKLCVTSISYSPAAVDNAAATSVTLTVQATSGFKNLGVLMPSGVVGAAGAAAYPLNPVSGSAGTYRGRFTVVKGSATGTFGPEFLSATPYFGIGSPPSLGGEQLAAGGLARLTVTGSVDTAAPAVTAFTAPTGTVDAARGGSVPVSVRLTDAGSGAAGVSVAATAVTSDPQAGTKAGETATQVALTRTAGTAQDGTWTGQLPLPGGTNQAWAYTLNPVDAKGNAVLLESADLTARGLPAQFRTSTTGVVPAVPTGLKVVSTFDAASFRWVAVATWNKPAAGSVAASSWLMNATGSCNAGDLVVYDGRTVLGKTGTAGGACKVTLRARNAVGTSAATSTASAVLP